jgi:single-strand DNA-binding protein
MFAKVQLMGRTGKDPDVKYFENGTVKASISVAVSRKYNSNAGESNEKTDWVNCVAWGKTAEILANFITKGDLVLFDGALVTESWTDKQTGQKRDKTLVSVKQIHLLPNKRDGENQVTSHETMANPEYQESNRGNATQANPDKVPDDIPF